MLEKRREASRIMQVKSTTVSPVDIRPHTLTLPLSHSHSFSTVIHSLTQSVGQSSISTSSARVPQTVRSLVSFAWLGLACLVCRRALPTLDNNIHARVAKKGVALTADNNHLLIHSTYLSLLPCDMLNANVCNNNNMKIN